MSKDAAGFYQRGADGFPEGSDELQRAAWGPIPAATEFLHGYGYETPTRVYGWDWSDTFGQWGAVVEFADGWRGWTWPRRNLPLTARWLVIKRPDGDWDIDAEPGRELTGRILFTCDRYTAAQRILAEHSAALWATAPF